jgi:hypothetical protein
MPRGILFWGLTMRTAPLFALLATAVACSLFTDAAQATQRARVFVASYGSDSNPCTFGSPCKTFQNAFDVVAAGGEITAIDSAGFGPLAINKAVTVTSPNGVEAGIAVPSNATAISIDAGANDAVVLRGLTLEGFGSAAYGIYLFSAARLEIINCAIRNYTGAGIYAQSSQPETVLVSNTFVTGVVGGYGIWLNEVTTGSIQAAINNVRLNYNGTGLYVAALTGAIEVQVAKSEIDNNLSQGIYAAGNSNSDSSNIFLHNVTLNQTPTAIYLGGNANIWLSHVTQTAGSGLPSVTGIDFAASGNAVFSDNTSHLMGSIAGGNLTTWTPQ